MTSSWQPKPRSLARRKPKRHRAGAAVVEFAFVAPLLIMLTFGMIELGRMVMVKQLMINASREGARLAVLSSSTDEQVKAQVRSELAAAAISGAEINVTPSLAIAKAGTAVTVSISINSTAVSWIPKPMFVFNKNIQASTTMRRESL